MAIRRVLLAFVLLALSQRSASAEGPLLTGYVIDDSGRRLAGVSIVLHGSDDAPVAAAVTDATGWYRLHASAGRYDLRFSRMNFGRTARRVTLADDPIVLVNAVLPAPPSARPGDAPEMVNQVTVGGDRFRRTRLAMSPRTRQGRLSVAFETLRTDGPTDAFERYGMLNGTVRYSRGDARQESSITGSARYARLAGGATRDADILSLGLAYERAWIVTDRLRATAAAQGELHRLARRGTAGNDDATAAAMSPTFAVGSEFRPRPWLTLDAGLGWAGSGDASVGLALEEVRGWVGEVRLHGAPRLMDAQVGYRLMRRTRILAGVVNLTNAPPADVDYRDTVRRPERFARATSDIDASVLAPRTVRFTVQFGF